MTAYAVVSTDRRKPDVHIYLAPEASETTKVLCGVSLSKTITVWVNPNTGQEYAQPRRHVPVAEAVEQQVNQRWCPKCVGYLAEDAGLTMPFLLMVVAG